MPDRDRHHWPMGRISRQIERLRRDLDWLNREAEREPVPERAHRSDDELRGEMERLRDEFAAVERRLADFEPRARPDGKGPLRPAVDPRHNVERFAPIAARYVRFTIRATNDGSEPCIDELELYGPDAKAGNLALASGGARATASSVFPNNPKHRIEHINDGRHGNDRSWISREPGRGWVQIELPRAVVVERISDGAGLALVAAFAVVSLICFAAIRLR